MYEKIHFLNYTKQIWIQYPKLFREGFTSIYKKRHNMLEEDAANRLFYSCRLRPYLTNVVQR